MLNETRETIPAALPAESNGIRGERNSLFEKRNSYREQRVQRAASRSTNHVEKKFQKSDRKWIFHDLLDRGPVNPWHVCPFSILARVKNIAPLKGRLWFWGWKRTDTFRSRWQSFIIVRMIVAIIGEKVLYAVYIDRYIYIYRYISNVIIEFFFTIVLFYRFYRKEITTRSYSLCFYFQWNFLRKRFWNLKIFLFISYHCETNYVIFLQNSSCKLNVKFW